VRDRGGGVGDALTPLGELDELVSWRLDVGKVGKMASRSRAIPIGSAGDPESPPDPA